MKNFKALSASLVGIAIFAGLIAAIALLFSFGTKLAFKIEPAINDLAGVLLVVDLIALPFALAPRFRRMVGTILFISSFVLGVAAWLYGFAATLTLWGVVALIIGLFFAGVGVVPIGLLAAAFSNEWGIFGGLLGMVVLAFVARSTGVLLASGNAPRSTSGRHAHDGFVEVEDVEVRQPSKPKSVVKDKK